MPGTDSALFREGRGLSERLPALRARRRFVRRTLNPRAQEVEQKRLDRMKLWAWPLFPQNWQCSTARSRCAGLFPGSSVSPPSSCSESVEWSLAFATGSVTGDGTATTAATAATAATAVAAAAFPLVPFTSCGLVT